MVNEFILSIISFLISSLYTPALKITTGLEISSKILGDLTNKLLPYSLLLCLSVSLSKINLIFDWFNPKR